MITMNFGELSHLVSLERETRSGKNALQIKITYMTNRKIICIVLALIFGLSLFASGAFARVACDKAHCKHHNMKGMQLNAIANSTLEGADCCAGTKRDACDFERGQALELHDCALFIARVNIRDYSDFRVIGPDHVPSNLSFKTFVPHPRSPTTARSAPIYIKNAPLII